jgi:formate hydrogenlyase subunit 3/multisubunit Na+/H+ antiporter MnhD subunit
MGLFPQIGLQYMVMPVLDSLAQGDKMVRQILPSLAAVWPPCSILLLAGSLAPLYLRDNPRQAGQAATLVLALAAVLVFLDRQSMDMLSFIFALIITVVGCANMAYSVGYMEHSHSQWRFYSFFLCMASGLTGVAISTDIFSFFLFWEIMSSWSLYFVIVHEENEAALREGFKYFFFNVLGAAFLFLGVILLIHWSGGGDFSLLRSALPGLDAGQIALALGLMATGFVMKAAQLPLRIDIQMHPATAPTPVSGYISSVLLKSAIFGLVKLFLLLGGGLFISGTFAGFGLPQIMSAVVWIGGITIVLAGVMAVFQTDIKLVLIYSTVSQLAYMVVGAALGASLGVAGGLLHLVNHAFFKDLLFLVAGAVIVRTHRQSMNDLGGLGTKMPVTLAFFCIGAACVIGLPPSSGFTSKWIIYHALMEQGFVLVAILSLVGSVFTLAYMAKMLHSVFLGAPRPDLEEVREAPRVMLLPMGFLAAGCVITSLFPGAVLAPLNIVLTELSLEPLDVAPWGINSGRGAWNATLTALLAGVAWLASSLLLKRLSGKERVTDIHSCGIPPEQLNVRTNPGDIYPTPSSLLRRWRKKQPASGA